MKTGVRASASADCEIKEEPLDYDELFESGSSEAKREEPSSGYQSVDAHVVKMEPTNIKTEYDVKQEEPSADLFCPTTCTARKPSTSITHTTTAQKCFLCGKITEDFFATCSIMRGYREPFLRQIMTRTADDWQRVMALKKTPEVNAYFCVAHVAKGPVRFNPPNRKRQEASNASPRLRCDLCEDPLAPVTKSPSPKQGMMHKQFFADLVGLTLPQRQRINRYQCRPVNSLSICSRHFAQKWTAPPKPRERVKPKLLMSRIRRCDICLGTAAHFITMKDGDQATFQPQLFDNLVTFSEEQQRNVEWFKASKERANICSKHLASDHSPQRTADYAMPVARIKDRLLKARLARTKKPVDMYAAMEEEFAPSGITSESQASEDIKGIKEEPKEIKEEPIEDIIHEVKPEPLDDFNADAVKEEPLVDLFDPSSGTSRELEPQEKPISPPKPTCHLCNRPVAPFVTAPLDEDERKKFFDSMRRLTPLQSERALYCCTHANIQAIVCSKHIDPSLRAPILK